MRARPRVHVSISLSERVCPHEAFAERIGTDQTTGPITKELSPSSGKWSVTSLLPDWPLCRVKDTEHQKMNFSACHALSKDPQQMRMMMRMRRRRRTRMKQDSQLAEWISHFQEQKLQLFVATLFRKHVECLCRIRSLQSLCTADWSNLSIVLLSLGKSHVGIGRKN